MWRFKPSKFKNAAPKVPKRSEGWVTDISVGNPYSYGNHIKASAAFIAFNVDSGGGGSLGILPIGDYGSKNKNVPLLNAHSEFVTDFDFCPYDDGILSTCSNDCHTKIWRIPEQGVTRDTFCNPLVDLLSENKVEVVHFHPFVDCIITTADQNYIRLWDVSKKEQIYVNSSHEDVVQSINWNKNGQVLASCGKDKKLHIWDPRSSEKALICDSHANNRDARVTWLNSTQLLTTGFASGREREVIIRDIKNLNEPLATYFGESSLGILIPLFDPDTNMLFLAAKADTTISYWEIMDKPPFFQEATKYIGDIQAKGAAIVPKRGLKVMDGEVNRILILGSDCIVPVSYVVPRKSYRDFHSDLFPNTCAPEPSLTISEWQASQSSLLETISLDPKQNKCVLKFGHELGSGPVHKKTNEEAKTGKTEKEDANTREIEKKGDIITIHVDENISEVEKQEQKPKEVSQIFKPLIAPKPTQDSSQLINGFKPLDVGKKIEADTTINVGSVASKRHFIEDKTSKPDHSPSPRRPVRSFGIRASKFRHLNGAVLPKETHISDISSLTRTVPGESDGFYCNPEFAAVPLGVAGGLIGILKLSEPGRAPSLAVVPGVICGTYCMDFCWDPFDTRRLVTACDNGDIQIWSISDEHLTSKVSEPSAVLRGSPDKASIVKFHTCAKDVICTAGNDMYIRIWDLATMEEKYKLEGHNDQILAVAWSLNGQFLATVCKDQKLRLYEPRVSAQPIREGMGTQGTRGARIVWVLNDTHLVVSGFNKVSERQVYLYDFTNISEPIGLHSLDVSPATLIPFYDEDSSTLFLTSKGDATVYAFEVAIDSPYFHPLSHYKCSSPHQALSFFPKYTCNVKEVEFAKGVRLTTSSIEPISFYVPRLRSEYFQDDIFPDTRVTWKPSLTSHEWFSEENPVPHFISLKPPDMIKLSDAPPPTKTVTPAATPVQPEIIFEGEVVLEGSLSFLQNSKEKEEMIVQSMMSQCQFQDNSLPQDSFDGVDPSEWDEEEEQHQKLSS